MSHSIFHGFSPNLYIKLFILIYLLRCQPNSFITMFCIVRPSLCIGVFYPCHSSKCSSNYINQVFIRYVLLSAFSIYLFRNIHIVFRVISVSYYIFSSVCVSLSLFVHCRTYIHSLLALFILLTLLFAYI